MTEIEITEITLCLLYVLALNYMAKEKKKHICKMD
jgi:hypothetical protein